MKAANSKYAVNEYGDRYYWTPLNHSELIDFIESRRIKKNISKKDLSVAANYGDGFYGRLLIGSHRFSKRSFAKLAKVVTDATTSQLDIAMDTLPEKIEAPAKIEKPIYGVMSIEQMITKIKAAGYKVMRRTEGWEEI
jgi:hypothetical protein